MEGQGFLERLNTEISAQAEYQQWAISREGVRARFNQLKIGTVEDLRKRVVTNDSDHVLMQAALIASELEMTIEELYRLRQIL